MEYILYYIHFYIYDLSYKLDWILDIYWLKKAELELYSFSTDVGKGKRTFLNRETETCSGFAKAVFFLSISWFLRACVVVGRLTEATYAYNKMQLSRSLQSSVVGRLFLCAIQIKKCFVLISRTLT